MITRSRPAVVFALLCMVPCAFAAKETPGVWYSTMIEDAASFATVAVLQQRSVTTIKDASYKNDVVPTLQFRCTPGDPTLSARIDWRRFISSFSTEAGFKVDGGRFTWLKWKVDQTEAVTISPSVEDSEKLLELLAGGEELLVEISPYSEGPVTAQFDLSGLAAEVDALRLKCQK